MAQSPYRSAAAAPAGMPGLVLCAHGTRDPVGAAVSASVAAAVAAALPGVDVRLGYADVQEPKVADRVRERGDAATVVVPLLLSRGYHVETDIEAAVAGRAAAVATDPLGPDPRLADLLAERLAGAGVPPDAAVVLGVAGSTRPAAREDTEATRRQLRAVRSGPVHVGYAAAGSPSVAEAVRTLRDCGQQHVAVAAYLLAPGHFLDVLRSSGADLVTEALGPAPQLVAVVRDRYAEGVRRLGGTRPLFE